MTFARPRAVHSLSDGLVTLGADARPQPGGANHAVGMVVGAMVVDGIVFIVKNELIRSLTFCNPKRLYVYENVCYYFVMAVRMCEGAMTAIMLCAFIGPYFFCSCVVCRPYYIILRKK